MIYIKTERMKNSFFNSISNVLILFSNTIFSFIVRTFFIKILGEQCLGLDGLFTNILSLLSLSELGISTAVSFSLYKPLAEKNDLHTSKLITFYKKVYRIIAAVILVTSLFLLPFLKYIVNGYTVNYNIYIIYSLYVLNTILSYLTTYKTIVIDADQKTYLLTGIRIIFNVLTYGLQLIILLLTKNLIFYLIIQLIFRHLERVITNYYIDKKYINVNFNCKEKIDKEDSEKIKENVKGILFHKIGNYAVNGTDNILISSIVNISTTGIYSNYISLVSIIKSLIGGIISSATSSFGNLNITDKSETKFYIFNIMDLICFLITGLFSVGIYFLINIFIQLWIGNSYLLNNVCVIIIVANFYLNSMLQSIETVKSSTGLYYQDRYIPLIQAIINLILSFVLGRQFGLTGILLATTVSYVLTVSWSKAYIIYKYVFHKSIILYLKKQIKNFIILVLTFLMTSLTFKLLFISNFILLLLVPFTFYGFVYSYS